MLIDESHQAKARLHQVKGYAGAKCARTDNHSFRFLKHFISTQNAWILRLFSTIPCALCSFAHSLMSGVDRDDLSVPAESGMQIDAMYALARC